MLFLYTFTIFLSAFLVFLVQPMVGKILLPMAGGSPSVWLACMFFFQSILLGGYLYAHYSVKLLGIKRQAIIHFLLTFASFYFLPISFSESSAPPENPALWLYLQLLISIGLPFLMISSLSPLIQVWFSKTTHEEADNPYFLYAASNIGSFMSLLFYPIIIEPGFELRVQTQIWSWGFALLTLLLLACVYQAKQSSTDSEQEVSNEKISDPESQLTIAYWVLCAFVPSSMLLGVTLFITTDLAPIPLLWVIPLMAYLLTFSLAFSRHNFSSSTLEKAAILVIFLFPAAYYFRNPAYMWFSISLNLIIFSTISLYCHTQLSETRPKAKHLTSFYAWIAFGGVLGGLFNSVVAPTFFDSYIEYPLMIAISAAIFSRSSILGIDKEKPRPYIEAAASFVIGIFLAGFMSKIAGLSLDNYFQRIVMACSFNLLEEPFSQIFQLLRTYKTSASYLLLVITALSPFLFFAGKLRINYFALSVATMLTLSMFEYSSGPYVLYVTRNFFGQKIVKEFSNVRLLVHGSTTHGAQFKDSKLKNRPTTYFHPLGPVGDIFSLPLAQKADLRAGVIGLGIGSIAAYAKPGQKFSFIEIDPEIIEIANDPGMPFSIISENASQSELLCGDGRLMMKNFPESHFDIFIVDAFSSDSIPVHLVTIQAVETYLKKLQQNGILVFHISNRYLDLHHVITAICQKLNLYAFRVTDDAFEKNKQENLLRENCEYMVVSRKFSSIKSLLDVTSKSWKDVTHSPTTAKVWTDSYSSILQILRKPWSS